jgi:hypothetical protein
MPEDPKREEQPKPGQPGSRQSVTVQPAQGQGPQAAKQQAPQKARKGDARQGDDRTGAVRLPTAEDLEEARSAKFGDDEGTVAIDADPGNTRGGKVELVYLDSDGEEVGREAFEPKDDDENARDDDKA